MGLDPREVDLICALHLDRPSHLHFHFEFYEKRPWLKNKRAAGYKYRSKGKVPIKAIDNMVADFLHDRRRFEKTFGRSAERFV